MTNKELHFKVKDTAKQYLKVESEMVELLIQMDSRKAYQDLGYGSLFQYCVQELKFSESTTSAFIAVSRKAAKVPELKKALVEQTLTVSKAAKLTGALDEKCSKANQEIIEFATSHSTANTEQWLREKQGIETGHNLTIVSKTMENIRKVRGLSRKEISLEEALNLALEFYIARHDPLERAKRSQEATKRFRGKAEVSLEGGKREDTKNISHPTFTPGLAVISKASRIPIPAAIRHYITLRDQNRCTYTVKGSRCAHTKYLDIHHLEAVADGGTPRPENLVLLCSVHHQRLHQDNY